MFNRKKPAAMTAEELRGLCNTDLRDAVSEAMMKEIHASRHAELLRKFLSSNDLDPSDLHELEISNSWEFEDKKKLYPFELFDKQFEQLYEKESIESRLVSYVRNNLSAFVK